MRFYTKQHPHYCGIDLHARTMYLCILDADGEVVLHRNARSSPEAFLGAIDRYREGLVVAVECIFTWYWLADLCRREGIEFVLGHALYMRAIHGGKAKNDRIDARKIAGLLRGGMMPMAYVYPAEMRSTRDLLRRRLHLVRKRGQLLAHIQNTHHQCNLPPPARKIAYKANREGVAERFEDASTRKSVEVDFGLIAHYDDLVRDLEHRNALLIDGGLVAAIPAEQRFDDRYRQTSIGVPGLDIIGTRPGTDRSHMMKGPQRYTAKSGNRCRVDDRLELLGRDLQ